MDPKTGDQQWPDYDPPAAGEKQAETRDAVGDPLPAPPAPPEPSKTAGRSLAIGLAASAALIGGAVTGAVVLAGGGGGGGWDDPHDDPTPYRTVITQEDLDVIAAELERAEGSTEVTEIFVDDSQHSRDDVQIQVTAAPRGGETLVARYMFSGDGWELLQAVETDSEPFDLAVVDPGAIEEVILQLREEATEDGDGIVSTGVTVHAPRSDYDSWLWVSLHETDDETWFGRADLEGNVSESGQL